MGLGLAFRLFFKAIGDREFCRRVEPLLKEDAAAAVLQSAPVAAVKPPARSEALTLLSVLQREGRLVDFLKEPIASYSDAQIGAAVRDIHRDCGAVLERLFGLRPVLEQPEGSPVEVPAGGDAARYQLTGHVSGEPPHRGKLRHAGWEAARLQIPQWNGTPGSANIVAPAEVEMRGKNWICSEYRL